MLWDRYDVVVIGGGIAGLAAGAMLAKDFGRSVLVIERAPFIGGRAVSFVGKDRKLLADGVEMGVTEFKRALAHARTFVSSSQPNLEAILDEGMLDGYTLDAEGTSILERQRVRCVLDQPVDLPVNTGLAFVDQRAATGCTRWPPGKCPGCATRLRLDHGALRHGGPRRRNWPNHGTPLSEWLQRSLPEAHAYIRCRLQTAMAEPAMTPTGDFLGYMMAARPIGMNLIAGSVATVAEPGPIAIAQAMEKALLAHGGEVRRGTAVTKVIVEKGRVRGVEIRGEETEVIAADAVICHPPSTSSGVLPRPFPADWVDPQARFGGRPAPRASGKRDVWADLGSTSLFVYMPDIISEATPAIDMVSAGGGANKPQAAFCFSTPDRH
jgi:choline dehydrogenase-like flavoprotein